MLSNKFTSALFANTHPKQFREVIDLKTAHKQWIRTKEMICLFENEVSNELTKLNQEQRCYFLNQILTALSTNLYLACYILDNEVIEPSILLADKIKLWSALQKMQLHDEYYYLTKPQPNIHFSEYIGNSLLQHVVGYELMVSRNKLISTYEIEKSSKTNPDYWLQVEKIVTSKGSITSDDLERLSELESMKSEIETKTEKQKISVTWSYGLNDFAEMIYRLERKGIIDLKSYFDAGGRGTDLARSFCDIFSFDKSSSKPAVSLNTYLSDLRKGLGTGALDGGIMKAIGRSREAKMGDVIPIKEDPIEP